MNPDGVEHEIRNASEWGILGFIDEATDVAVYTEVEESAPFAPTWETVGDSAVDFIDEVIAP
jgi:hypothetical protein